MRWIVALLLIAATCFGTSRVIPHHTADSAFGTLYLHLMPAPLMKPSALDHGDEAGDSHGEAVHGEHGESEHAEQDADDYLFALPLPAALATFSTNQDHEHPVAAFTNLQAFQVLAILMIVVLMSGVARYVRTGSGDSASRLFAGWVTWIRDEMVYPVMGRELGSRFLPYFLFVFFFIVFMNLLGLVPLSATATASIFVTAALALTTLLAMIGCGMVVQGPVAFWKNLVPHVPLPLWPLMFLVEVIGLIVKPFALLIRLFANMTGGHLVVLSFMGLIFALTAISPVAGWASSPIAVGFAVFIMIIEAFVALLQAYIFTQLSIIFVNASVHPEH